MTPERWRRVGELFDAPARVDPAGREAWLGAACGGMEDVAKLLDFGLVRPTATARATELSARPGPRYAAVYVAGAGQGRPGAG
jgi:hypothetical protein